MVFVKLANQTDKQKSKPKNIQNAPIKRIHLVGRLYNH